MLVYAFAIPTPVLAKDVTTSILMHLPGPIYDMEISGTFLFVLASTGQGASGLITDEPIPNPAFYEIDRISGTVIRHFDFKEAGFPTEMEPDFHADKKIVYFNNISGKGALYINIGSESELKCKTIAAPETNHIAVTNSLIACAETSGILSLWTRTGGSNVSSHLKINKVSSFSSGYDLIESLVPLKDDRFALTSKSNLVLIDRTSTGPSVLSTIPVEVIPASDGFLYPHRTFGVYKNEIYLLNGENAITIVNQSDKSSRNHALNIADSITDARIQSGEILCTSISGTSAAGDGFATSIAADGFTLNWSARITGTWLTNMVRAVDGLYYAGDRDGNVVCIKVE